MTTTLKIVSIPYPTRTTEIEIDYYTRPLKGTVRRVESEIAFTVLENRWGAKTKAKMCVLIVGENEELGSLEAPNEESYLGWFDSVKGIQHVFVFIVYS